MLFKQLVGYLSCLRESVHASVGFVVHMPCLSCFFLQFRFVDDLLRDVADVDSYVFWSRQWQVQVEIGISIVMNFSPSVDIVLLKRIFGTNRLAVGVATSPG